MKKTLTIINVILIILVVIWNGYTGANGLGGNTVGGLSDAYDNLFTPAAYAFSIWGIIFIGLLLLGAYMVKRVFIDKSSDEFVIKMGPWLIIANALNCLWIYVWLNEYTLVSIFVMLGILISLLMVVVKLNLNREEHSSTYNYFVALPISIYTGWISVATVANFSAYLGKIDWNPIFSEQIWCIILILVAAVVNGYMVSARKMYGFGFVGLWAIAAILMRHLETNTPLVITSVIGLVLIVGVLILTRVKSNSSS